MKQLKNWSILMLIVMAMPLMVACGDDENNSQIDLLGTWYSETQLSDYGIHFVPESDRKDRIEGDMFWLEFKKGGDVTLKFYLEHGRGPKDYTYTVNGNTVTFTEKSSLQHKITFDAVYISSEKVLKVNFNDYNIIDHNEVVLVFTKQQ